MYVNRHCIYFGLLGFVYGSFRKFGVAYFGVLIIRILVFRELCRGHSGLQDPRSDPYQRGLGFREDVFH